MRRILVTACSLAIALVTACGSDSGTGPLEVSPVGTWNLATVNGAQLPFTFQTGNPKLEILSDQYILASNGTFTETFQLRGTDGTTVQTQNFTDGGTYTLNGTAVTLRYDDGASSLTGTLSGNTVTIAQLGASFVYTRQ